MRFGDRRQSEFLTRHVPARASVKSVRTWQSRSRLPELLTSCFKRTPSTATFNYHISDFLFNTLRYHRRDARRRLCLVLLAPLGIYALRHRRKNPSPTTTATDPDAPVSVNFFPSRKCNYTCGFCFHTGTSSFVLSVDDMKRGLHMLRDAGMRKLNIA